MTTELILQHYDQVLKHKATLADSHKNGGLYTEEERSEMQALEAKLTEYKERSATRFNEARTSMWNEYDHLSTNLKPIIEVGKYQRNHYGKLFHFEFDEILKIIQTGLNLESNLPDYLSLLEKIRLRLVNGDHLITENQKYTEENYLFSLNDLYKCDRDFYHYRPDLGFHTAFDLGLSSLHHAYDYNVGRSASDIWNTQSKHNFAQANTILSQIDFVSERQKNSLSQVTDLMQEGEVRAIYGNIIRTIYGFWNPED